MKPSTLALWLAVLILLAAAALYTADLMGTPPGLEPDELIEAQIAGRILSGDLRPFYPEGQGREALYHYALAGWLALLGEGLFTLRIASVFTTLIGLAASFALMRRLFGLRTALFGLLLMAGAFPLLFAARAGLRSVMLLPLAALAGALWYDGLLYRRHPGPSTRSLGSGFWALCGAGALTGLSVYAYTAARILPLALTGFLAYMTLAQREKLRGKLPGLVSAGLLAALIAAPLFFYLRANPGADELAFEDFDLPLRELQAGNPAPALQSTLRVLGAAMSTGDPLLFNNLPDRPLLTPVGGLLLYAGIALALWQWRHPGRAFALIWLAAAIIPSALSQPAPNWYRLVLIQPLIFAFPVDAILQLFRPGGLQLPFPDYRGRTRLPGTELALGLALCLWEGGSAAQAYFVAWPQVEGVSYFWQSALVDAADHLADHPADATICTELTWESDPWWRPAYASVAFLHPHTDLPARYAGCRSVLLILPGPARLYLPDVADPHTLLPPEFQGAWLDGAILLDGVYGADTVGVAYQIDSGLEALIPAPGPASFAPEAGGGPAALPVHFGQSLQLIGYRLDPAIPQAGQPLRVLTAWIVTGPVPPRLNLFTQLLSDPVTVITQQDSLPVTTQSLRPGDRFLVLHDALILPADAPPGTLISIGLYHIETGARLPISAAGSLRGDRLLLGE